MELDWSTLALQALNLAILVWLLHHFLYRPVLRTVDARRAEIDAQYAAAAKAESAAEALRVDIEKQRAEVPGARAATMKAATAEAEQAAADRIGQAEAEAKGILVEARGTIADERARALTELRGMAVDLGAEIAGRLLSEIPVEGRAEIWMHRIEAHLSTLPAEQRDELTAGRDTARLRVVTDMELPEPVQAAWRSRLRAALGPGLDVDFAVDETLLAGAELHFPDTVLRFSWRSALDTIRSELAADEHAG